MPRPSAPAPADSPAITTFTRRQSPAPAPAAAYSSETSALSTIPAPPSRKIREKIARRMRESLASTAQYTLHASADATGVLAAARPFQTRRPSDSTSTTWSPSARLRRCSKSRLSTPNSSMAESASTPTSIWVCLRHAARAAGPRCDRRRAPLPRRIGGAHEGSGRASCCGNHRARRSLRRHFHHQQSWRPGHRSLHAAAQSAASGDSGSRMRSSSSPCGGTARSNFSMPSAYR